jgi:pyrroline-5-carboxylate reductase
VEGTLAIIGTGRIGEALLRGLLRSSWIRPEQVVCTARRPERCDELVREHGVEATTDNAAAIRAADVVLIALKPQVLLTTIVRARRRVSGPTRPSSRSRPARRPRRSRTRSRARSRSSG